MESVSCIHLYFHMISLIPVRWPLSMGRPDWMLSSGAVLGCRIGVLILSGLVRMSRCPFSKPLSL
ncbi:hypothetical protein BDV40DRAFT_274113 [Aspergillus tamarii]|uniref:Uncharacterized protein n=1 Tax=Aspergillus tamarii TaxID=41984 RepID=A0A5N6UKT9_ASPTM|nr:hypothetical protein BDV40DRAFT_274113 [Aspergillus tamarii]